MYLIDGGRVVVNEYNNILRQHDMILEDIAIYNSMIIEAADDDNM